MFFKVLYPVLRIRLTEHYGILYQVEILNVGELELQMYHPKIILNLLAAHINFPKYFTMQIVDAAYTLYVLCKTKLSIIKYTILV